MALISKNFTFSQGSTIVASEHNSNNDTIYNEFNGNIDNNNIKSNAGITDGKLAQITTASKVHGTSLTGLADVPAGAGRLPSDNFATTGVFDALALTEQSDSVSTAAAQGKLYTKEVSSQSELFFRTDSDGDEVQMTLGGGLVIGTVLDYGTSSSASTTKAMGNINICYGLLTVGANSTVAVSNLPFSDSTTYSVTGSYGTNTTADHVGPYCSATSGSTCNITNPSASAFAINWIAIGT